MPYSLTLSPPNTFGNISLFIMKDFLTVLAASLAFAGVASAQTQSALDQPSDSHTLNLDVAEWAYVSFDAASVELAIDPFEISPFGGGSLTTNSATIGFEGGTNSTSQVKFQFSTDVTPNWTIGRTVSLGSVTADPTNGNATAKNGAGRYVGSGALPDAVTAKQAYWQGGSIEYRFQDPDPLMAPGAQAVTVTIAANGF